MNTEFALALPYPAVDSANSDNDLLRLYDLYAGRFSELTAICTYSYQSVIAQNPCVERLVSGIAQVEMFHLKLLAKAIFALGGDPVYAGRYNYFSGRYADYEKDVCVFLSNNAASERQTAENYREAARLSYNRQIKELLERIAMDEEMHVELFTCCYNDLCECRT